MCGSSIWDRCGAPSNFRSLCPRYGSVYATDGQPIPQAGDARQGTKASKDGKLSAGESRPCFMLGRKGGAGKLAPPSFVLALMVLIGYNVFSSLFVRVGFVKS